MGMGRLRVRFHSGRLLALKQPKQHHSESALVRPPGSGGSSIGGVRGQRLPAPGKVQEGLSPTPQLRRASHTPTCMRRASPLAHP